MSKRVICTRKATYRTKSNTLRKVKLPGGRLSVHYMGKTTKG